MGVNFAVVDCRLDLTGSDNVESFWSDNGMFVNVYGKLMHQNVYSVVVK